MLWNDSDKANKSLLSAQKASSCLKPSPHKNQLATDLGTQKHHILN